MDEFETWRHLWLKFSVTVAVIKGPRESTAWPRQLWAHVGWVVKSACLETRRSLHKLGRNCCAKTFKEESELPPPPLRVPKLSLTLSGGQPGRAWPLQAHAARVMSGARGQAQAGTASSPGPCQFVSEDGFLIPFQSSSN